MIAKAKIRVAALLTLLTLVALAGWYQLTKPATDSAFQQANGRIEATEIAIASKIPGRIEHILVTEGELVQQGQLLVKINPDAALAELEQAKAQYQQAQTMVDNAKAAVLQRHSERAALAAQLAQRQAEQAAAQTRARRTAELSKQGAVSAQLADDNQTAVETSSAAVVAMQAQLEANQAAIHASETQVRAAEANQQAVAAAIKRLEVGLADTELYAPKAGRIQYRVLQEGEIVAAGGRILNLIDLTDVYMTFFLPTRYAGQLTLQSEARIIVDARPDIAIPARISFIADVAQFTPKTVETHDEREKLMFRVKARISPQLLQQHLDKVKTGLPGVVWVRLDDNSSWPDSLPPLVPVQP
jgi:HlyD family secretion protein